MSKVNRRDMAGGLLVAAGGAAFALQSAQYPMGQLGAPGPGTFPLGVALVAVALGLILCVSAVLRARSEPLQMSHRAAIAVVAAVATFGILIQRVGLAPTVFVVVIIAALGSREMRPLRILGLAFFMSVGCWLVFIEGLGMTMPAFRSPL